MLVVDLRNNGGGVFAQGVAVAQQLLAEGTEVVLIADRCVDLHPASARPSSLRMLCRADEVRPAPTLFESCGSWWG